MDKKRKSETFSEKEWEDEQLKFFQSECDKYGYKAFWVFDELHIRTRFEAWYCILYPNGCIKLMHSNTAGTNPYKGFHKQFTRHMDYRGIVQYIHEHETAKYEGAAVDFHFTKKGKYRRAFV